MYPDVPKCPICVIVLNPLRFLKLFSVRNYKFHFFKPILKRNISGWRRLLNQKTICFLFCDGNAPNVFNSDLKWYPNFFPAATKHYISFRKMSVNKSSFVDDVCLENFIEFGPCRGILEAWNFRYTAVGFDFFDAGMKLVPQPLTWFPGWSFKTKLLILGGLLRLKMIVPIPCTGLFKVQGIEMCSYYGFFSISKSKTWQCRGASE